MLETLYSSSTSHCVIFHSNLNAVCACYAGPVVSCTIVRNDELPSIASRVVLSERTHIKLRRTLRLPSINRLSLSLRHLLKKTRFMTVFSESALNLALSTTFEYLLTICFINLPSPSSDPSFPLHTLDVCSSRVHRSLWHIDYHRFNKLCQWRRW